ncbi:hypothetical protein TWF594_005406 [Orbilia oligospora]|nr:hypothetical protein TWF594_005406 [Orbilia oligospora]
MCGHRYNPRRLDRCRRRPVPRVHGSCRPNRKQSRALKGNKMSQTLDSQSHTRLDAAIIANILPGDATQYAIVIA